MTHNTTPLETQIDAAEGAPTLSRQLAAAANETIASEKGFSARVASANTSKARMEMLRAVSAKKSVDVRAALARGTDPNFLMERGGELQSPLRLAARENWIDGVMILLENSAVESFAHAQYRTEHPDAASRSEVDKALRHQAGPWHYVTEPKVFALFMQTEPDAEFRARCARTAAKNAANCLWLISEGLLSLVEEWTKIEMDTIGQLRAVAAKEHVDSVQAKMIRALWKAAPERLQANVEARWGAIVEADALELMAELARADAPEPADWSAISARKGMGPRALPLWTLALASSSLRVAHALGKVEPLRQMGLAHAKTHQALSGLESAPALREAARQGVDLARVVDAEGNSPLHLACASRNPSKTTTVDLVKVFPAWMDRKNNHGQDPSLLLMKGAGSWVRDKREKLVAELQSVSMNRDLSQIKKTQKTQDREAAKKQPKKKNPEAVADGAEESIGEVGHKTEPEKRGARRL